MSHYAASLTTLSDETQIVPAVPWHYLSKQHLRASAAHSQDRNGTSATKLRAELFATTV